MLFGLVDLTPELVFEDPRLVGLGSFERNRRQTYRGSSTHVGWMRGMLVIHQFPLFIHIGMREGISYISVSISVGQS